MSKAYLGIGSNMGDKRQNINRAIELLKKDQKIQVTQVSSYYQTEPVGYKDQDWFLNIVLEIETALSPHDLLKLCQAIEAEMKRERLVRFGPRIIDIDILLYKDYISADEELTVPHPRMAERGFVLIPLYEIAGNLIIGGKTIEELLFTIRDNGGESVIKLPQYKNGES